MGGPQSEEDKANLYEVSASEGDDDDVVNDDDYDLHEPHVPAGEQDANGDAKGQEGEKAVTVARIRRVSGVRDADAF